MVGVPMAKGGCGCRPFGLHDMMSRWCLFFAISPFLFFILFVFSPFLYSFSLSLYLFVSSFSSSLSLSIFHFLPFHTVLILNGVFAFLVHHHSLGKSHYPCSIPFVGKASSYLCLYHSLGSIIIPLFTSFVGKASSRLFVYTIR